MDEIEEVEGSDTSSSRFPSQEVPPPIVLKGTGEVTIFGLCCKYDHEFPHQLSGRLAPEEFSKMINRINSALKRSMASQLRWLVAGFALCVCSAGCSFLPVVCLSKRTRLRIQKLIDYENHRLYHKLGLRWGLVTLQIEDSPMFEYVIKIEYLPKIHLTYPD